MTSIGVRAATSLTMSSLLLAALIQGPPATAATVSRSDASILADVTASGTTTSALAAMSFGDRAAEVTRCFDLRGAGYCLGIGFTEAPLDRTHRAQAALASAGDELDRSGGAMSMAGFVNQRAALSDRDRAAAELDEVRQALQGIDKVKGIWAANRAQSIAEASAGSAVGSVAMDPPPAFPMAKYIIYGYQVKQERSYWCGPATFQSIDWADDNGKDTQTDWASSDDLGTTVDGTSITKMVSHTNLKTNWDVAAGSYQVVSVASWTTANFLAQHKTHIGDSTPGPIIEHPKLLRQYFSYLASDHGGHFTVGRGYDDYNDKISYFEVYNERDFSSSGNETWGVKYHPASLLLSATKANSGFQNIGM